MIVSTYTADITENKHVVIELPTVPDSLDLEISKEVDEVITQLQGLSAIFMVEKLKPILFDLIKKNRIYRSESEDLWNELYNSNAVEQDGPLEGGRDLDDWYSEEIDPDFEVYDEIAPF